MDMALTEVQNTSEWAEEAIYYALALSSHGQLNDTKKVISLLKGAIPHSSNPNRDAIEILCKYGNEKDVLDVLRALKEPSYVYWIVQFLDSHLSDKQFIFRHGRDLMEALRIATKFRDISAEEARRYRKIAQKIEEQYMQIVS